MIATLEDHINRTEHVSEEVRLIHEFVMSTNFSEDRSRLAEYLLRVEEARISSVTLFAAVNLTLTQVCAVNASL